MEKTRKFMIGAVIGFMLLVTLVAGVFAVNAVQNTQTSHGVSNTYDQARTAVSLEDNPEDNGADGETNDD